MSFLTLAAFLLAQAAPATAPGTEVRALTVRFQDQKGAEVTDLSTSDVALLENGVNRDITSFKPDRRPLSVALIVDTSAAVSAAYRLSWVEALSELIARLPEGTRLAIWTTGDRPNKILDFSEDQEAARKALRWVAPQGGNCTLDALVEASQDLKSHGREGDRKVVIAVTATGPETSHRDKYWTVDESLRNAELFLSVQVDESDSDADARERLGFVLDRLAVASGGRSSVVLSPMGIDSELRKVSQALRAGYRLAYATVPELKRRKLELRVARPGTKVILPQESVPRS